MISMSLQSCQGKTGKETVYSQTVKCYHPGWHQSPSWVSSGPGRKHSLVMLGIPGKGKHIHSSGEKLNSL